MAADLDLAAEHAGLVAQLRAAGRPGLAYDSNTSSGHAFFCVSAPNLRRIARGWLTAHRKSAGDDEVLRLAARLITGEAYEEKVLGAVILGYSARGRRLATPDMVDGWLDNIVGWAEIDSLCASVFPADHLAADWPAWRALIARLSRDPNINKRRAALVLLTTPCRTSDDPRFRDLAFEVVERLKSEKPILITKALSWLLRSMSARHAAAVSVYLEANASSLPAIALRETRTKLRSGTKSGRPSKVRPRGGPAAS